MKFINYALFVFLLCLTGPFAHAQWTPIGTSTGPDIYNTWSGRVGIGTTTPGAKLDVTGDVRASNFTLFNNWDNYIGCSDNGNNYHLIGTYRGWDAKAVYVAGRNAGNASATGVSTATERVYIGNPSFNTNYLSVNLLNGSVGIGTTTPGSFRLAVEGKIGAREVVVTSASPWPDYVFSNNYKLPSLTSLHQYIIANHRLPGMPSADSVAANGIDLGTNQALLLKKIEELTLYVIDQQKQLATQQQQINQLMKGKRSAAGIRKKSIAHQ